MPQMAKCSQDVVGSLALDRPAGVHFRLWPAFSGAAFRRKLFDSMFCGVSCQRLAQATAPGQRRPEKVPASKDRRRSERLFELLNLEAASGLGRDQSESEVKRKVEVLEELRNVVSRLQVEEGDEKKAAAMDVRRLAKDDPEARVTLAMLGAIPILVGMLDVDGDSDFQIQALYALLNLGIGNDMNKAAIVKTGAVHKMLKLIELPNRSPSLSEAVVANFLGLSALDSNKPIIGSSGAISFLSDVLQNGGCTTLSKQAKQDSLRALFNLSISPSNIPQILELNLLCFLFDALGDMEISERILSILCNIVSVPEGWKAVGSVPEVFPILIDVLNWTDSPPCQEKAAYVLMVMAHKAWWERQAMVEAGIVSALLELTLLGSTLAQRRASRILECLRVDKGKQVLGVAPAVSAPLCGGTSSGMNAAGDKREVEEEMMMMMMSEERRAVKQLVQQSLQNNMRRMVKRANLPPDFALSERFRSLTASSTSKSLPL